MSKYFLLFIFLLYINKSQCLYKEKVPFWVSIDYSSNTSTITSMLIFFGFYLMIDIFIFIVCGLFLFGNELNKYFKGSFFIFIIDVYLFLCGDLFLYYYVYPLFPFVLIVMSKIGSHKKHKNDYNFIKTNFWYILVSLCIIYSFKMYGWENHPVWNTKNRIKEMARRNDDYFSRYL